ncbi:hypothetical protein H8L32_09095 [Undibacterium sp. CY18W]|uniref:DUF2147 domain-containing protein n=1 Tax=Undibacterium hunanense TaxID=2762292 RepID=A0ABR6ZP06_9BURK|nr:hypothetical protein [Undibacterium hunanense]MBC3917626.1 hypothetical protein [Undibacterium hunanense]
MIKKKLVYSCLLVAINILFLLPAYADQYGKLAGSYRLVSDLTTNPDGTVFECGKNRDGSIFQCQTVKGKIQIEALPDHSYVYLEAYTVKGVGTMGNLGNYQLKQDKIAESTYTTGGLYCCSSSLKQLTLDNDTLKRQTEGPNFKRTTVWKRENTELIS